jgi:hypothetical protein
LDFMKIIYSLEQALYEVMTWLVFFPRTLWRCVFHPIAMMEYSDKEQQDRVEEQYTETRSPPIFLLLCLLVAHGIELLVRGVVQTTSPALNEIYASHQALLTVRAFVFSVFPLMFALAGVRHEKQHLDRKGLRSPFFGQCFLAGPLALQYGLAAALWGNPHAYAKEGGVALVAVSTVWYIGAQTGWFRRTAAMSLPAALWLVFRTFLKAVVLITVAATIGVIVVIS